jgi:iron complex outermembrane recepter protein
LRHPSTQIAIAVSGVLRALAIGAPVALGDAPAVLAQSAQPAGPTVAIPAQPLGQALAALARQTGLQVLYVSGLVRNQTSHAVPAGLSANAALVAMLQGTGLRFAYLTANSVRILAAAAAPEPRASDRLGDEPSEVIITASRREENFQDVPIAIQTMTGDQLSQLNVTTFDDLLQYTPNVTYSGNGPGTGNIFIRGLGFVGTGNQTQATTAPFPAVALYLDNQSMQFPARNNDVYLVDMARVEVLEGPQGTLDGGGAQAGVIRYVTNKPNLSVSSGEFNAGYGTTAGGDPNSSLNATLNLPLIPDTLAVRAVIFSERRGGYISNVPGTIAFPAGSIPAVEGGNPSANNAGLVASDTNPVTYEGLRLSALYQGNDDWNLLIQQNYQDMDAEGYFYAYPQDPSGNALRPYQITAFTPAFNKDRYESTAWTLNGRFGELKAVYSGSYLVRHIEAQQDYSNYLRSVKGSYYACIGSGAGYFNSASFPALTGKPLQCYPPVGSWYDSVRNTHQTHELRVSTGEDRRLRALLGAFWEKFVIDDNMNFNYLAIPQCSPANLSVALAGGPDCLSAVGPFPGVYASDPSLRENMNNAFGEDVQRGYKQYAFFASVDFDLIPKVLTLSGGTRRYHYDEFEHGSEWYSETTSGLIVNHPNGACTAVGLAGLCGFPLNLDKSESGFSSRANLTWHLTPDIMTYYTFAQGFRPGGFNRAPSPSGQPDVLQGSGPYCGAAPTDPRCLKGGSLFEVNTDQAVHPLGYDSDILVNNELGFKSEFLSHRLLLNASAYRMNWDHVASYLFDPTLGAANWTTNGPSYTINGVELQFTARLPAGLTLQGASSWNSVRQANSPCLTSAGITPMTPNNPTPAGECITVVGGLPYSGPWGPAGTAAPFAPPSMFNLRARYDWSIGSYRPFAIASAGHIATMSNAPGSFPDGNATAQNPPTTVFLRYTIPAYTIYDASFGVVKDSWTAQISGSNLTNAYAATNVSAGQFIRAETPLRPRVVTAMFGYKF